jgi:hypothetical protein
MTLFGKEVLPRLKAMQPVPPWCVPGYT